MAGGGLWLAYRLRWKRRRFLFRIWRKRRQISAVVDRTQQIKPGQILLFATMRNEAQRLPHFLDYYRRLGVNHFLIVDNQSTDGTPKLLTDQPDVSHWTTQHSYRLSRFGMDWIGHLLRKYGHGHWCLTVDADELLVFAQSERRNLHDLTAWLDSHRRRSFGAMLLDLYPKGPIRDTAFAPGDDPLDVLTWFDADTYRSQRHAYYGNIWIQGGVRERLFFAREPARAPTLNKTPLVKWHRSYTYVSSTHQMLPRKLHQVFVADHPDYATGALLHTKFLPVICEKSKEELTRKQHFQNSDLYTPYHEALSQGPNLWHNGSTRYEGPQQLVQLGLMSAGNWG